MKVSPQSYVQRRSPLILNDKVVQNMSDESRVVLTEWLAVL